MVWAGPCSLAATRGITLVFSSSAYLDVSVRRVSSLQINAKYTGFTCMGCPIRRPSDQTVICTYPKIIAAYRVLHRLWEPRHPPCALLYFLLPRSYRVILFSTYIVSRVNERFALCFCAMWLFSNQWTVISLQWSKSLYYCIAFDKLEPLFFICKKQLSNVCFYFWWWTNIFIIWWIVHS